MQMTVSVKVDCMLHFSSTWWQWHVVEIYFLYKCSMWQKLKVVSMTILSIWQWLRNAYNYSSYHKLFMTEHLLDKLSQPTVFYIYSQPMQFKIAIVFFSQKKLEKNRHPQSMLKILLSVSNSGKRVLMWGRWKPWYQVSV